MTREEAIELMSNEDAIFILSYIKNFRVQGKDAIDAIDIGINAIKQLPSVTQKSGKWVHFAQSDDCSECGWSTGKYGSPSNFCPNCGADMRDKVVEE